jgi:glutamate-1-semialdehyde 2,1-aminomutase
MSQTRKSEAVYKQACEVITGGVSRNTIFRKPHPDYAATASGCYITDIDGIRRVDFANNMASLIHGHAHPAIVEAVTEQLHRGTAFTMASQAELNLAGLLIARVKGFEKMRFMNSGTEAVMAMIKASRAYSGKPKIAKAEGTYHGTYDFAEVSQVTNPQNWGSIESPNSVPLAYGTPKGVLENVVIFPFNDIEHTIAVLDRHAADIAAVLIDPVPHRVGLMPGKEEYIKAVYDWTRRNNALLIFDEVVTFRVGYGGMQENYSIQPDMTAMGKIIGGGFPVGAVAGRTDIMKVFDPRETPLLFPHSGTFSANPISMTAGYIAMQLFDRPAVERLNELTRKAIRQIEEMIKVVDVPVSITGAGSMFRFHLRPDPPKSHREAYQDKETVAVIKELLDYMYVNEHTMMINTFSCMLSTVMTQVEIDRLTESLQNAFRALKHRIEQIQNHNYA